MRWLLGAICVMALAVIGCSESSDGPGGAGGEGAVGGDGGSSGDGGGGGSGTATLSVFLFENTEGGRQPLGGVQLCETGTSNCATTDGDGTAAIELPVDQEISYTVEKEGYVKGLRADVLGADGSFVPSSVSTDAQMAARFDQLMSPYPMEGTGTIYAQAFADQVGVVPIPGATFELIGATGNAFYVDDDGEWSLDLTATTSQGGGGFVEVSPGEHELRISGVMQPCQPLRGWPSDSEDSLRAPVREGYMTITRFYCPTE